MADYQLTATDAVIRYSDKACIPADPANRDYNGDQLRPGYLQWLAAGGVPDPYVPPPPAKPSATGEQATLYDHENRLLAIEGKPPLSVAEFLKKTAKP